SRFNIGDKCWFVNLCEHANGKKPLADLTMAQALSGTSTDPCVGKFLEFRIGASQPLADRPENFTTGAGGQKGPWGVSTDNGPMLNASWGRISAAPGYGTREVWTLQNGG